jgi:hypothetical protein
MSRLWSPARRYGFDALIVDGRLVVFNAATFAAGLVAALLLGHLVDALQARLGLAEAAGLFEPERRR